MSAVTGRLILPGFARDHGLTNYDAAYLALAQRLTIPLATNDRTLRLAATSAQVNILVA